MQSNLHGITSLSLPGLISTEQEGSRLSRPSPLRRAKVIQRLEAELRQHLSFSLEQVHTSSQQHPIECDGVLLLPDLWVATLAKNPVRSRTLVEPGLIVHVFAAFNTRERAALLRAYRGAYGAREILAIDIHSRSVEIFRRDSDGGKGWLVQDYAGCFETELETIQFNLSSETIWPSRELF